MSDEMKPVAWCNPLEAYADSYAQMSRDGDGRVDCRSVEVDIRQNMMPVVAALVAERDDLKKRDDEWLAKTEWAQELGGAFPEAAGLHRADVMVAALLALKGRLAKNATLEAERDAYRDMAARKSTEKVAEFHRANAAERERDEARREKDELRASRDAEIQEMSEKFRAVNIERLAPHLNADLANWCQENAARADAAEAALAEAQAEVERLRKALTLRADWHKCSCPEPCADYGVFPGGCAGRYRQDYLDLARTALKGGQDDRP